MFEKGEYVYHETGGICKIEDICVAPLDGMPADRLYYVLRPMHDQNCVNYLPVDSSGVFLRKLMDRSAAESLLVQIPKIDVIVESNAKILRAKYMEAMKCHEPAEWVRVIKTAQARIDAQGGKLARISESERNFSDTAKRNLCAELSLALSVDIKQIECAVWQGIAATEV
jgi:CarD family transcriptional regulator